MSDVKPAVPGVTISRNIIIFPVNRENSLKPILPGGFVNKICSLRENYNSSYTVAYTKGSLTKKGLPPTIVKNCVDTIQGTRRLRILKTRQKYKLLWNFLNIVNIECIIHEAHNTWNILRSFKFAEECGAWEVQHIFLTAHSSETGYKAWVLFPNEDITNEHNGSVLHASEQIKIEYNGEKASPQQNGTERNGMRFYRQSPCLFTRIYSILRCHATVDRKNCASRNHGGGGNRARGDLLQIIPSLNTVSRTEMEKLSRWWMFSRARDAHNGRMINTIIDRLTSTRYKAAANFYVFLSPDCVAIIIHSHI